MVFRTRRSRRKLMLFPLMDMFFVLLLFFLVAGTSEKYEMRLRYVVPQQKPGHAQVLLQMVGHDSLLWIDSSRVVDLVSNWSTFTDQERRDALAQATMPLSDLPDTLKAYAQRMRDAQRNPVLWVAIRCPSDMIYSKIREIQTKLLGAAQKGNPIRFHFSLLEGTEKDLLHPSAIRREGSKIQINFRSSSR